MKTFAILVGVLLTVLLTLSGCAALMPTPAQQRVHDAFQACRDYTGSQIGVKFVSPDGKSFMIEGGGASDQLAMKRCLADRYGFRFDAASPSPPPPTVTRQTPVATPPVTTEKPAQKPAVAPPMVTPPVSAEKPAAPAVKLPITEKLTTPPPSAPTPSPPPVAAKKELACIAEARRGGADPQQTPAAFRFLVEECVKR